MCGDYDSVLGMNKNISVRRQSVRLPYMRHEPATGRGMACGIYAEIDNKTGPVSYTHLDVYKRQNDIVSGFIPISSEIDPRFLMQDIAKLGAKLCLPRIDAQTNNLNFHEYAFGDALKSGAMGLHCLLYTSRCV